MPNFPRLLRLLPVAVGLTALAVAILSQASVFHVQDDAYMYARYAWNLSQGDGLAWNPGGEATYGATALLYVPWVAAISSFFPGLPGQGIVVASVLGMLLGLSLMALMVARAVRRNSPGWELVACVCVCVAAAAHRKIAAHAGNGMDTGFAMASLAFLLFAWHRALVSSAGSGTAPALFTWRSKALILGAGWFAFAARPDLGLYALGIPLTLAVLAPGGGRRGFLGIGAACAALVLASIAWAWWYFGAPVPLSFYIKSLATAFGAPFLERHTPEAREQFIVFLLDYAPLWAFAVLDLPSRWKARKEGEHALWLAVFAATFLHWMYYRFGVLQLVAFHQRFYYPSLPALFFLGATSLSRVLAIWPGDAPGPRIRRFAVWTAVVACALVGVRAVRSGAGMLRSERVNRQFARFELERRYDTPRARALWFGLDDFSRLPEDLVIATTEVGLPAAMNPEKRVVDLVGLNENGFARNGFDARRLCAELVPDVLYMPHPDYTTMIAQIEGDATFRSEYEYCFPSSDDDRGVRLGLALRRASPHIAALRTLVAQRSAEEASRDKDGEKAGK